MDWSGQIDRLVGPLAFIVLLVGGTALVSHRPDGVAVDGDFTDPKALRVLAVKQGPASPAYVSFTMQEVLEAPADRSPVSFLLPEDTIHLRGGDLHRARVRERHAHWQWVEYEYARGKWKTTTRYRAFGNRVESVQGMARNHWAVQYLLPFMAIPALLGATFVHYGWAYYRAARSGMPGGEAARRFRIVCVALAIIVASALFAWMRLR